VSTASLTPLGAALRCELLKARRARVPLLATAGFSLAPFMAGLFMIIMKDPEHAVRLGLLRTKAAVFAGEASWPAFLDVIAQAVAVGGSLVFALIMAWVFGREFAERTVKTLLAVPTPRWATVAAKLILGGGLALLMSVWVFGLGLLVGALVGLPGGSGALLGAAALHVGGTTLLTILLLTPIAFLASVGRGYMAPLGFAILTLFLAQITAATGWGPWFPWSVPALYSGLAGPAGAVLPGWSFGLVAATSLLGLIATLGWWRWADQTT
jgi:ABC-2 type transport system permease protein